MADIFEQENEKKTIAFWLPLENGYQSDFRSIGDL